LLSRAKFLPCHAAVWQAPAAGGTAHSRKCCPCSIRHCQLPLL
jgi:hypothetical protein